MNPEQLLLRPEYIYLDIESQKVYFCCLPGFHREIQEQFKELTEYILPKLDHEDEQAVVLGYGIYKKALEAGFQLETVKAAVYHKEETKKENKDVITKEKSMEKTVQESKEPETDQWKEGSLQLETKEKEKDFSRKKIKKIVPWVICIVLLLSVPVASAAGYLPWIPVEAAVAAGILALGLGALAVWILEKKNRKIRVCGEKGMCSKQM